MKILPKLFWEQSLSKVHGTSYVISGDPDSLLAIVEGMLIPMGILVRNTSLWHPTKKVNKNFDNTSIETVKKSLKELIVANRIKDLI